MFRTAILRSKMPTTQPIPVIASGGGELIGRLVVDMVKPEYEVIHFTLASAITNELPALLSGHPPATPSSTLGSGNWAQRPQALLLGGAYTAAEVARLQALVREGTAGTARIPWLRVDNTASPPATYTPTDAEARAYGAQVARRWKRRLDALRAEGRLGEGNEGVYEV